MGSKQEVWKEVLENKDQRVNSCKTVFFKQFDFYQGERK